jgi:hypothetical protein
MAGLQQRMRLEDTPAHSFAKPCPNRERKGGISGEGGGGENARRRPRGGVRAARRARGARAGRLGGDLLAVDAEEDLDGAHARAAVDGAGSALELHARVGDPERLDEAHVDGARERADEQVQHRPRHAQPLAQAPAPRGRHMSGGGGRGARGET